MLARGTKVATEERVTKCTDDGHFACPQKTYIQLQLGDQAAAE